MSVSSLAMVLLLALWGFSQNHCYPLSLDSETQLKNLISSFFLFKQDLQSPLLTNSTYVLIARHSFLIPSLVCEYNWRLYSFIHQFIILKVIRDEKRVSLKMGNELCCLQQQNLPQDLLVHHHTN